MKALTSATMALAAVSGVRNDRTPMAAPADHLRPLSFEPPADAPGTGQTYNLTRNCVLWRNQTDWNLVLEAPEPAANCYTNLMESPHNPRYANITTGFARATCPENGTDAYLPEAIYTTYRFSTEPHRTFLERPVLKNDDRLCLNVHSWDLHRQTQALDPSEVIQPVFMQALHYVENCVVQDTPSPTAETTAATPELPFDRPGAVGMAAITGLSVLGAVAGVAGCVYRARQHLSRVAPPMNDIEIEMAEFAAPAQQSAAVVATVGVDA